MNLFLDTSAFLKLYHDEEGTDSLWNFIIQYSSDLFISVSDLSPIEFHSSILKHVRIGQLEYNLAIKIIDNFNKDKKLLNIIIIDSVVKNHAVSLINQYAAKTSLKTLDALQLSTAIISNYNFPIDYFIASDEKLIKVAQYFLIHITL